MAQGAFEGGVISIRGDASQVKEELSEVSKLLTELEKNKIKLKPEFDSKNIEKQINQLGKYMEGRFGALDFSKVHTNLMEQLQSDPNKFAEQLSRTMHGFNLLDQAVKPEDINKLAAASAEEIFDLIKGLRGLADTTKATGKPVTKRLLGLYEKYPNGIEGKGGSGHGNGFGASEKTLNKISETLERIDGNVKSINDSIKTGAITVQAAAEGAENVADKTKEAADAQAKLTEETKKTAKAEEQLGQAQEKNNEKKKDKTDKKVEDKKVENNPPVQSSQAPSSTSSKEKKKESITSEPEPVVPIINTKSLEDASKKEEELRTATEGANQALQEQNIEIQDNNTPIDHATTEIDTQQVMLDAFLDSAKKAGAITQELGQKQEELAKAFQNANIQIEEQNENISSSSEPASSKPQKGLTFTKAVEQIGAPKEIAKYLKDPKSIKTILKGFDDESLKGLDIEQILDKFSNGDDEKLNKALNDRVRRAAMYVQQIAAMFPDDWEDMFSGFSIFSQGVMGDWKDDIGAFFELTNDVVDASTGEMDDSQVGEMKASYDQLVQIMEEWADLYNTVRPMLDKGMSKKDIDARLDLMKGFTEEDIKSSDLGASGTVDLYSQKIEETQQRLDQMAELKTLLDQEVEAGRELSTREWDFLDSYQNYVDKGNAIIQNASARKAALENPEAVREVAKQKAEQRQQEGQITFSQDVIEAAHAQEELAKSVRDANSALKEQNDTTKDNIMYHMGNLSASKTKEISHPFGDEFNSYKDGQRNGGRGWADGTGLYVTAHNNEYTERTLDNKDFTQFYAIDTSGLKLYEAHTEEAASDFYNFIHHLEQLCLTLGTATTEFDNEIQNIDDESLYQDFQRVFPGIKLTFEQFEEFIESMSIMVSQSGLGENGIENGTILNAFKKQFGAEDIKTRFLKMLGYEGTDLTGTSYGGIQSGSVIFGEFDKKRIITSGKDLNAVVAQAEQTKRAEQEIIETSKTVDLEKDKSKQAADETKKNAEDAKKNADNAKKAAEEGKKAVEQAKENQKDAESIVTTPELDSQIPVNDSEQADAKTKKEVAYVQYSQDTLKNYLQKYSDDLKQIREKRNALLKEAEALRDGTFDTSQPMTPGNSTTFNEAIELSGQSKEEFLKGRFDYDMQQLDAIEKQIVDKHARILRIYKLREEIEQLEKDGYEVQVKKEEPTQKNNKKGKKQQKEEIEAEIQDIEEAEKLLKQEKEAAENARKKQEEKDQALRQLFGEEGKDNGASGEKPSGETKPRNPTWTFGSKLEGGADQKKKGGATIRGNNIPNYTTPGTRGGNGTSNGAQQVKVVYQVETTTEDLKATKRQLNDLDKVNKNLTTSANQVADAINKEAEALGKMAENLTKIGEIGNKVASANQTVKEVTDKAVNEAKNLQQPQNQPPQQPNTAKPNTDAEKHKQFQEQQESLNKTRKYVKELRESNQQYQNSIDNTFDEVDTPEKALEQFKVKAKQLEDIDREFVELRKKAHVVQGQFIFDDFQDKNQYDKLLGQYYQSLIEYRKAGQVAVDKGVEPTDIRNSSVYESGLLFNYEDGQYSMEDYIEKLKEIIAKNDKSIQFFAEQIRIQEQELQALVDSQGESPVEPETPSVESDSTATQQLKGIEQKKDQYKRIIDQIKAIEDGRTQAEEEIARHNTSDTNFKVGRSKNKAYDLIKTYAEQLKQDYEAYEKLDPNDVSDKAKEIRAKYETSRVAFDKAASKLLSPGIPKDKMEEGVEFGILREKHGVGSEGFDEAEKHVADNLKFLEERLNQQKQQAEAVLNKLYAERDRLQQELTSPSSQVNVPLNGNNPPANQPDLGGGQSANGIRAEGDEAGNAVANMQALAQAKKEVTETNQKLSQSAQETTKSLNGEGGAGSDASKAFDPKPLQDQIDAQKKAIDEQKEALEQQKNTIDELRKANDELTKAQAQASKERMDALRKENEEFKKTYQTELEQRRQAELDAQVAANLQKKQFEEDERIRKEQEAKAAQKAEERAKKAEENARIKAEDKDFSKLYTAYGNDFGAVLDAKSIQEFDMAVAHLTETERQFWEARMLQAGGTSYAYNADILKQNDLPEGYEKSVDNQTAVLKQREMAIAEYTANVIAELEKQEAAFEKMDALYQIDTEHPANGHASFIQKSLVDEGQTRTYVTAIEDVSESLQRMREIVQSMKDGTFDFGNIDALRELLELRQNLPNQMTTAKDADKAYKKAQSDIEADSIKKAEQYKTVLSGLEKQIETIQRNSRKLINPDDNYKVDLEAAKDLLATIQVMIEELNANPLQFMGKQGDKNAKDMQSIIDTFKDSTNGLQEDFFSQKGVQGRINTYLTSYKGAYTSFFREIKDSFKSEALGELQSEIDKTFVTFENSITDLNRATGLKQGEFLTQYLNANGGKASASQIEQQQKVRNAIAESYRGLITDISNELTKVQDRMGKVLGEDFLKTDYFQKFGERFTAGLGSAQDFNAFQDSAQKARDSFSELQKIQKEMADGKLDLTSLAPDELKKRIEKIVGLFANLNENYKKVTESAKEFTFADAGDIERQRASIAQFLKSNQGISVDAQNSLRDYFNQLQQGISQADLTKLTDEWHQVADAEQAAGRTGATFMSELQTRFKSLSAYLLSFVSFYRIIGVFKDGINIIHELDDALTEMQKVSDESLSSLQEYQKGTFDTANQIGTTAAQLQQSTADWMRLGEDLQSASQSAQTANVLFNVSEFDSIDEATTALVAMSAAYADAEKDIDKMDIVDRLNLIGNNYAIATDELATALQDGAATLQTAGNDLDQAIALTTAGNEKIA